MVRTTVDGIVEAVMLAAVAVLPILRLIIFEYKQNKKKEYKKEYKK